MTGSINKCGADDGEAAGHLRRHKTLEFSQVAQLLRYPAGGKLRQRRFVFLAHCLQGKAAGKIHGGCQFAFLVEPKYLAAKDDVGNGVTDERDVFSIDLQNIMTRQSDLRGEGVCGGVGAQNGQVRRLAMIPPIPHHHHLHGGGSVAKTNEVSGRQPDLAVVLIFPDHGGCIAYLDRIHGG